ncbi:MAG TPA: cbb3-type cytochrome c oxidase subunit I [Roseiflexaceae bacterium]|nr:cbb3-type cytochrome c oxidase subunit I [Roseiflexaceae bacterium]
MSALTVRCARAALIYLALGIALGVSFALDRALGAALRPLHAELNLWGWVTLLIYGMGYHMLPRFAGRPLRSQRLADAQSWLAIAGVALAALGWAASAAGLAEALALRALGGGLQLAAALLFAILIGDLLAPRRGLEGRRPSK